MLPSLPRLPQLALVTVFFFVVTFGVYGASLHNQFVSWDDSFLIVENPIVASMNEDTIKQAFTSYDPELYIPLTFLSYQIDHAIAGLNPLMFHLTNLIFHTLNALLVTWFLFFLLENGWLALSLGLLFAVHPLNSEAVLWAAARKDVLSTFFFFASAIAYLYGIDRSSRKLFWLSIFLFTLGLLSKVMVVTLPIVLLLLDAARGRSLNKKTLLEKVPYFLLAFTFGIIGIFGKTKVLVSSTLWQKILMAGKSIVFYLQKFLWPTGLSVVYPYTQSIEFTSADFAIPFALTLILLIATVLLWKRNRMASFALAFFVITLLPTFINFAKGGDLYFASDRYAYVPMVGLLLLVGVLLRAWLQTAYTVHSIALRRNASIAGSLIVLVFAAALSVKQPAVWHDSVSLYENALAFYPNARAAHNNLGMEQMLGGDVQESIRSFNRALAIQPDPKTKINLAAAYVRLGRLDDAEKIYREVLASDPDLAESEYGLGNIEQKRGNLSDAVQHYRKAIGIDPEYFNAYNNLGGVYLQMKDWTNAVAILKKSIELKPTFIESSYNLALALMQLGQNDRAEALLLHVLEMNPSDADALANLALLLYNRKNIDSAASYLQQSLAIDSSNPTAVDLVLRMRKDGYVR